MTPRRTPLRRLGPMALASMGFLLSLPSAFAQNVPCNHPLCPMPADLEKQLVARYHIDLKELYGGRPVSCKVLPTSLLPVDGGPICSVTIRGPLQPPPHAEGATPVERARSISRAILDRDAALFGIADPGEMRETSQRGRPGEVVSIFYARFIGDVEMAFTHFSFAFRGDGTTLYQMHASLSPAPPELYEAAKRERLSADEATVIIALDLGWPVEPAPAGDREPAAGNPERPPFLRLTQAQIEEMLESPRAARPVSEGREEVKQLRLLAYARPPYVRWHAQSKGPDGQRWGYMVDALTGEIVLKSEDRLRGFSRGSRASGPARPATPPPATPPTAAPPPAAPLSSSPPPDSPPPGN